MGEQCRMLIESLSPLPFLRWGLCGVLWLMVSAVHIVHLVPTQAFVLLSSYAAYSRQYEVGTTYSFVYETSVLLNEPLKIPVSSPKDVGFKVDLQVDLSPVWQKPSNSLEQLLELKVTIPKLSVKSRHGPTPTSFVNKPSRADGLKTYPFFIYRDQGLVKKVFYSQSEELSLINIKKGIASLFQYQLKDGLHSEQDSSGTCNVIYEEIDKTHWVKTKTSCRNSNTVSYFNHTNKVMGALIESQSATTLELNQDDYSIQIASAIETHFLRPEIRRKNGAEVVGRQILQLTGHGKYKGEVYSGSSVNDAVKGIAKSVGESLLPDALVTVPDPKECIYCKTLGELIGNFRSALKESNLATQASCIAFIRLLRKMRESDDDVIKRVLSDKKNARILPQLIDIVAATQTISSHTAAKKFLDFKGQIDLPERYLLGLAVNTHPTEPVIEDILNMAAKGIKNAKLYETLVLSLSSMAHTFAKRKPTEKIVSDVEKFLLANLDKCKEESCKLIYIRALRNFRSKNSLPHLLKLSKSKAKKTAIWAIKAVQAMPSEMLDQTVFRDLERIALELDSPHDSSVKMVAIDILLKEHPSEVFVKDLFNLLTVSQSREFNTILLNYIFTLSEKDQSIKQIVDGILSNSSLVNYNTLSQGGSSSAFTRPLSEDEGALSFFTNMLEINGGLLKRSTVDVMVEVDDKKTNLLSFGVFAGGLSVFGGGEGDGEDDEEANAGIEVSILDSQLRPFILFNGQGELMGHVWSGTGSERTTALQGSVLLQDHSQIVPLQNGINAELLLTGVASYDFAGQIQISLWNRNSHSLVDVRAAMVLQGQIRVDNLFVQTMIEYNIGGQTRLDLISDLDFSGNIAMCMQMSQPEFEVIHNVRKLERIPGSNYALRKYKKRKSPLAGKTFVMNRKNTEFCNKMFR